MRGLLDKDKSYLDIASGFFGREKKKSKKRRFVQLLDFALNLGDRVMTNRVSENLDDLNNQKVFDIANRNDKWIKLSKVIDVENNYRNNPNYFMNLATEEFNAQRPNFDADKTSAQDFMNAEIKELADAKLREHQKQMTGIDDVNITREQFMKPLEDYYRAKEREIADPANRSVIHKGLSFLGVGKKRRAKNAEKVKDAEMRREKLGKNSMGFLQGPTFTADDAIDLSRTEFKYDAGEASRFIQGLEDVDATIKRNIISNLDSGKEYSDKELNNLVFINSQNWNATTAKVNERVDAYNSAFLEENNLTALPTQGPLYNRYIIGRRETVGNALGFTAGSKTLIEVENLLIERDLAIANGDDERLAYVNSALEKFETEDKVEAFQDLLLKEWYTNDQVVLIATSQYKNEMNLDAQAEPSPSEVLPWWLGESLKGYESVIYQNK